MRFAVPVREGVRDAFLLNIGNFDEITGLAHKKHCTAAGVVMETADRDTTIGYLVRIDVHTRYYYGYVAGCSGGWMACLPCRTEASALHVAAEQIESAIKDINFDKATPQQALEEVGVLTEGYLRII